MFHEILTKVTHDQHLAVSVHVSLGPVPGDGGGGGKELPYEKGGDAPCLALGFWSHLG